MLYQDYLNDFELAKNQLNQSLLNEKQLLVWVGFKLDSVVLKLYKKSWTNDEFNPLDASSRIFFSVWLNNVSIAEEKVYYNIHALKLRELKRFNIKSRDFAESFRKDFKNHQADWENVSVDFGPLTLMEGFMKLNPRSVTDAIVELANNFLKIENLIDDTLHSFKKN